MDSFSHLVQQRAFMRMWFARLFGGTGNQMLLVALGATRAFQMPAQQALTPLLVPANLLARAMAFSASGIQVAVIGGPALGGLIFVAGASVVYLTCAAFFVVALILILRVHQRWAR